MALEHRIRRFHTAQRALLSIAGLVSGLPAACSSRIPVEIVGLRDDWTHWDDVA